MAFPTTTLLDDFDRADASDLGADWSANPTESASNLAISSNQAKRSGTNQSCANYYNPATYGPDVEAYFTIGANLTGTTNTGVICRLTTPGAGTADGYRLSVVNNILRVFRYDNGSATQLGSDISVTTATGDSFGIWAIGGQLLVYQKASGGSWTWRGVRSDATYSAAGYLALATFDQIDQARFDNFSGGTHVPTVFSDAFAGTADTNVSSRPEWMASGTGTQVAKINASNQVKLAASADAGVVGHDTGVNDHYAQCVVRSGVVDATAGAVLTYIHVRGDGSRNAGYGASWDGSTHRIRRLDNGGIVASLGGTLADGDVMRLSVEGAFVQLYKNGTSFLNNTDSTFTTGRFIGMGGADTDIPAVDPFLDDFEGGPLEPIVPDAVFPVSRRAMHHYRRDVFRRRIA